MLTDKSYLGAMEYYVSESNNSQIRFNLTLVITVFDGGLAEASPIHNAERK